MTKSLTIHPNGTFHNLNMRVSAYWSNEKLAEHGITNSDIQEGRVDYFALLSAEEQRIVEQNRLDYLKAHPPFTWRSLLRGRNND